MIVAASMRRNIHRRPPNRGAICFLLFAVALHAWPPIAFAGDEESRQIRRTIERSVPYIERHGAEWIASKDCLSCHHTSFMIWSLNAAKRAGVAIDQDKLDATTAWATDWKHLVAGPNREKAVRDETLRGQSDTLAQLLLGRSAGDSAAKQPQWFAEYATALAVAKQADGSWTPGGQLPFQKRPKRETQEVSTMWASLAILAADAKIDPRSPALKKSREWLGNQTDGQSTEWWATRLMLSQVTGYADETNEIRAALIVRQHTDGGWGWLCNDKSDALGTGLALFALSVDDSENVSQARADSVLKGTKFLLESQGKDGSWPVRGTKQSAKDHVQPTATYWGTCWAVIALCETLEMTEPSAVETAKP
jgi:squalene-hopene/tetraprenyl-beta-curcumene cyclase